MASSVITWLTVHESSLTAGDTSSPTKCKGTFLVILVVLSTRWKSVCRTCGLYGCIWKSRNSTCSVLPFSSISRMVLWKASFFKAWNKALWSISIMAASPAPKTIPGTRPATRRRRLAPVPCNLRSKAVNFMKCSNWKGRPRPDCPDCATLRLRLDRLPRYYRDRRFSKIRCFDPFNCLQLRSLAKNCCFAPFNCFAVAEPG